MEDITWSKLKLSKHEAAAKGTQIKYKLGIKDGSPITVEQLKRLKQDLNGFTDPDYNLPEFLESITDFDEAAGWLSSNAYSRSAAFNLLGILKYPKGMKGF